MMVPFVQIFAISYILMPMQLINMEAVKSLGYSNITLKLEVVKKVIEIAILVFTTMLSVQAIAWGVVLYNFICLFINLSPNIKLLNYSFKEQCRDFMPQLLAAVFMGGCIFLSSFLPVGNLLKLLLQFIVGISSYFIVCRVFSIESFMYVYKSFRK